MTTNRLSIVQVISQARFSGAEHVCLNLSLELQRRGHRVLLLCKDTGGFPEEARKRGLDVRTPSISGKLNFAAPLAIGSLARRFGADLIHSHLSSAALWGSLAGRLFGIPTIGHIHALNTYFYYRFSHFNLTCSDGVRRAMLSRGAEPARIRVVYNGIDPGRLLDLTPPQQLLDELNIDAGARVIACVGHLTARKGQIHLLRAMARLSHDWPQLHCLLVGVGNLRDMLREQARQLGIGDRVHFLGFRRDAVSLMNCAEIVVLPSISKEGLGLALIEAELLGKPTIGSDAPGIDEVIEDEVAGLLVPPADDAALAGALHRLLADSALRQRLGAAGRERAGTRFTVEAMTDACETAYAEVLARYRSR